MSRPRSGRVVLIAAVVLLVVWWFESTPPPHLEVGDPIDFSATPQAILAAEAPPDALSQVLERVGSEVPGHDDLVLREDRSDAFASGMDGWIWLVPLDGGPAERFVDVPMMPSGLRPAPDDKDILYFCASRLHGETHPDDERVGLYRLTISTREVSPVVTEVPMTPAIPDARRQVYADADDSAADSQNKSPVLVSQSLLVRRSISAGFFVRTESRVDGGANGVTTLTSDEHGDLLRSEFDQEGDGTVDSTEIRELDGNGNLTALINDDGPGGTPETSFMFVYDANGNLMREEADSHYKRSLLGSKS